MERQPVKDSVSGNISGPDQLLPGFRHVLEAALFFGVIGGLADVSYLFTRNPDLVADLLAGLRFVTAGIFLTAAVFVPYLLIVFLIVRPIASARKWSLALSLTVIYFFGLLPAGAIVVRNFAVAMAVESILVAQIKILFYFLKYLWVLIPVCWAGGVWLSQVRTKTPFHLLYGRLSSIALSAGIFMVATTWIQQRYLLNQANVTSELTSSTENMVITAGVFTLAMVVWPIANLIFVNMARVSKGIPLNLLWLIFLIGPFVPPLNSAGLYVGSPPSGNDLAGQPYNVMLVSIDTVRYDEMGFNGNEIIETPMFDELAETSVIFDNAMVPMPMTGPSHISMFTGLQPDPNVGHGVKSNGIMLAEEIPTIATILNDSGYATGAVIGGFPLARQASATDKGFNYYHDTFTEGLRSRFLPDQVWYLTVAKLLRKALNLRQGMPHGNTKTADTVTDKSIEWLEENHDQPFFMFVHYFDAHYMYIPPEPWDSRYMPDYDGPLHVDNGVLTHADLINELGSFTDEDFEYYRSLYRGEISYIDQEFERLYQWGEERNLWDNTLLIVVSDHGEGFEHDYYFHHTDRVYEQLIHVPMFIRNPGGDPESTRTDTLVNVSDIFFTVLDFLDVEPPRSVGEMHNGVFGSIAGWDHNLLNLETGPEEPVADSENEIIPEEEPSDGWTFVPSQSYTFTAPGDASAGRFFTFRFDEWQLIYGPDAEPYFPTYQYYDMTTDIEQENDLYPGIDWMLHPMPDAPEVLEFWSSQQGAAIDEGSLDPRMRAELKALGYIQEGNVPLTVPGDEED